MKKIAASQSRQAAYYNITSAVPNATATAVDEPPIDQGELLQVIFTIITKHGLTQSCIPDLLELTKLLIGSDMEGDIDCLQPAYKLRKALEEERRKHTDTTNHVVVHHFSHGNGKNLIF